MSEAKTPGDLTLEQEFRLAAIAKDADLLTKGELITYLVEVVRQGMVKDNLNAYFRKHPIL